MGANMNDELKLWKDSLLDEDSMIKESVYRETRKLAFKFFYIKLKRVLLSNAFISVSVHALGDRLFRSNVKVFNSLEDCLKNIEIASV